MKAELLKRIANSVGALPSGEDRVVQLRRQWPDVHFSYCLDDEIGVFDPIYEGDDFNLYLVSGAGGCGHLTRELQQASGLVVADLT